MNYENKIINDAIENGHQFVVLEPECVFDASIKEFHEHTGRLVYDVEELLNCLSDNYDWDPVQSLEWFDYNIFDLTFLDGGPIFYDKFEEKYLTIDS